MPTKKSNIVFFFTDGQRFDTIHALGNDKIITPNMDKLVKNGHTFTHAHIPGGTCGAVCMPSRAMVNTGKTLFHLLDAGASIPDNHTTLGEVLRKNGYRTFGTGKWHNGGSSYKRSFTDGAEIFFGGMADHWNVPACNFDPNGGYEGKQAKFSTDFMSSNNIGNRICDHITPGKHSSELLCDSALNFIEEYDSTDPFYMYIAFLAPHDPRTMPEDFRKMYNPNDIELPENFLTKHPFDNGELEIRDELLAKSPRESQEIKKHIAEYYAMITHLDYQLGKLMDALKEKGVLDNTIIVFSGDNGLALGQHGLMGKQNCYDHSVRVPLIFSGPNIQKNVQSNALVYLCDIYPTLCDLVGIEIPESVESKSLYPTIQTPKKPVRDSLYFAYTNCQRAIRKEDYKLIEYVVNKKHTHTQLFNLKNDPKEIINLAQKPEYEEKICELRKEMFALRDEWDDEKTSFGKTFWGNF